MLIIAPSAQAVGLGELRVATSGELIAYSLGSCVAVCLYDPIAKVAGMAHVVLPAASPGPIGAQPGKFADTAVPALLEAMAEGGAERYRLIARIVGGAAVLDLGGAGLPGIGQRNVAAVKAALQAVRLPLRAELTGGNQGRTARLDVATGRLLVRSVRGVEVAL